MSPARASTIGLLALVLHGASACSSKPIDDSANGSVGGSNALGGASSASGGIDAAAGDDSVSASGGGSSIEDLPFAGSCLEAAACTDEWDSLFGEATLGTLCENGGGTWSSSPCDQSKWQKKCTQMMADAVYIQYLPRDGVCDGVEAPL